MDKDRWGRLPDSLRREYRQALEADFQTQQARLRAELDLNQILRLQGVVQYLHARISELTRLSEEKKGADSAEISS